MKPKHLRQQITMLPSIGKPDPRVAARLLAPVILSLWGRNRERQAAGSLEVKT
jgi:hypothetical protein